METADFDVQEFTNGRYAADRAVHARFYLMPVKDERASDEAGRPMFRDVEFVEIIASGNANNIIQRKATNEDRQRFSRQYEIFKRNAESDQTIGTPLTQVPWLTPSQVEELAYMKIRSLEMLASVDDNTCARFAGLYDLKRKAAGVLEAAQKDAPVTKMAAENARLKNQVEALTNQLQELIAASKKAE